MPSLLREFFGGWYAGFRKVGNSLAILFNTVFLTFAYVIGVGPSAILAKIVGKRFLQKEFDRKAHTYWVERNLGTQPLDRYRRQF